MNLDDKLEIINHQLKLLISVKIAVINSNTFYAHQSSPFKINKMITRMIKFYIKLHFDKR